MDSIYNTQGIEVSDEVPKDFYRAISVNETKVRVQKGLRKMLQEKREEDTLTYYLIIILYVFYHFC